MADDAAAVLADRTPGPSIADLQGARDDMLQVRGLMKAKNFDASGAPTTWRLRVGSYPKVEDQIAELKKLGATNIIPFNDSPPPPAPGSPDDYSQYAGADPSVGAEAYGVPKAAAPSTSTSPNNFIYTSPDTGRPTLYRPSFWKDPVGGAASAAPEIGEGVGAGLGAAAGTAVEPGVGTAVGAGAGGAAGRSLVQGMIQTLGGGVPDTRSLGSQALDLGTTALTNAGLTALSDVLPGPSTLVRSLLSEPRAASREALDAAAAHNAHAAATGGDPVATPLNEAQARLMASDRQSVPMDPFSLSARKPLEQTGGTLASLGPFSSLPSDVDQSLIKGGNKMDIIADQISPGSSGATSRTVADRLSGAADQTVNAFDNTRRALQGGLDALAPPQTRVGATNTQRFLSTLAAQTQQFPGMAGENEVATQMGMEVQRALQNGTISLQELKSLRQRIGQIAFGEQNIPGTNVMRADAKTQALYNAVRQDYLDGAASISPQAGQMAQQVDSFIARMRDPQSAGINRLSIQDMGKLAADDPDTLANAMVTGKTPAGRTLEQIKQTIYDANPNRAAADQQWNGIVGAIWRRMASASPGSTGAAADADMSFLNLASNWKRMGPATQQGGLSATQQTLLNGLPADVRGNMLDMITLAKGAQDSARSVNWSHSGDVVNTMGMMNMIIKPILNSIVHGVGPAAGAAAGSALGPLGTAAGVAGGAAAPEMFYRLMGYKPFQNWLSGALRTPNPATSFNRLAALASSANIDPGMRQLMQGYLQAQGYQQQ